MKSTTFLRNNSYGRKFTETLSKEKNLKENKASSGGENPRTLLEAEST